MSTSGVLAAVTHRSLMFSHHGSAERDCCGKWEQLVGWKMKRDTFFIESDVLLIHFHTEGRKKHGFGSAMS